MERLVSVCTEEFQFLLGIGSAFVKYTAIHRARSFLHHPQHLHFHREHFSRGPTMRPHASTPVRQIISAVARYRQHGTDKRAECCTSS